MHQVRLGVDRLRRRRTGRAARTRAAVPGMNCAIPCAPGRAARERVEVRLGVELRGEQRGADVPALRGAADRGREPLRDERRHPAAPVGRAVARRCACPALRDVAEVPRLPRVALDEAEPPRVGGEPAVGGGRAEVELGAEAVQRLARAARPTSGRGARAKRAACSAFERKPLVMSSATPVGARRRAPSGRTPARRRGASACPGGAPAGRGTRPPPRRAPPSVAGGASSASARAEPATRRPSTSIGSLHGRPRSARARTSRGRGTRSRRVRAPLRRAVVQRRRAPARGRRRRQVPRVRPPADDRRLEQPPVRVVHRPRARERREVRRALLRRLLVDAARERRPRTSPPTRTASSAPTSSTAPGRARRAAVRASCRPASAASRRARPSTAARSGGRSATPGRGERARRRRGRRERRRARATPSAARPAARDRRRPGRRRPARDEHGVLVAEERVRRLVARAGERRRPRHVARRRRPRDRLGRRLGAGRGEAHDREPAGRGRVVPARRERRGEPPRRRAARAGRLGAPDGAAGGRHDARRRVRRPAPRAASASAAPPRRPRARPSAGRGRERPREATRPARERPRREAPRLVERSASSVRGGARNALPSRSKRPLMAPAPRRR